MTEVFKMRNIFYPYKLGSVSCKSLSDSLEGIRVRSVGRYKPRREDLIVNWGNDSTPQWNDPLKRILNPVEAVHNAKNKIATFQILQERGVPIVKWTTDWNIASDWDETTVVRHLTKSYGGRGIEIFNGDMALPRAPLYTKYVNPKSEYRVHVFNGCVIDYVKKRRRNGSPATEDQSRVRNLNNGWIFTRDNLTRLERIEQMAIDACNALGLDFGAVDIIRDQDNVCMVLEVNTAPGLKGRTLEAYKNAILEYGRNTDK